MLNYPADSCISTTFIRRTLLLRSVTKQSLFFLFPSSDGKRFVEDDHSVLRQALQSFYALLRGTVTFHLVSLYTRLTC